MLPEPDENWVKKEVWPLSYAIFLISLTFHDYIDFCGRMEEEERRGLEEFALAVQSEAGNRDEMGAGWNKRWRDRDHTLPFIHSYFHFLIQFPPMFLLLRATLFSFSQTSYASRFILS